MKHAIAPYLQNKACILQLPKHSDGRVHAILLIDAWPTHLTESFRSWMKHEYPWIHVAFVPANCTPIAQPADCGLVSAINQLPLAGFDDPGIREASSMVPCGQSRGPHAGAIGAILPTMTWTLNSATHTGLQEDRDPQGE